MIPHSPRSWTYSLSRYIALGCLLLVGAAGVGVLVLVIWFLR